MQKCGVTHLLAKPVVLEEVLRTVAEVLGTTRNEETAPTAGEIERDHVRLLNNAMLEKVRELEMANHRLTRLIDLGRSLALEGDLCRLLDRYCRSGCDMIGARYAVLGVLEENGEGFDDLMTHGFDSESAIRLDGPSPGEGLLRRVVVGGVPLRAGVGVQDRVPYFFPGHPLAGAFLGVPVATPGHRYGVLAFIDKLGNDEFDADDEALAVSLAAQLAVAYEGTRRQTELARGAARLERYEEQLAILRRIDQAILSANQPRELASAVVRNLRQLLGCWSVGVWVFDWETRTAERLASEGATELLLPPGTKVPLDALDVRDLEALSAGQDRIIEDVSLLPEPAQTIRMLQTAGLRSYTRIPLALESQVIGTLVLSSDQPGSLDAEQLGIAHQVADHLAIAMRHALLFHQVRTGGERLRTLSHQLLKAQEEERRRIARELHDEIGQSLTAVKINLQGATGGKSARSSSSYLRESVGLIDVVLRQVRNLSLDLRPSVLDDLGLAASVRSHLDRTSRRAGFVGSFAADPPEIRLLPEIETECFRVVQEALTNVVRHAGARRVEVTLFRRGDLLELVVQDDGAGFDVAAARRRAARGGSLGLLGMQERAALLGGAITIEAVPGRGTKVHLRIPLADPGSSRGPEGEEEPR